MQNGKYGEAIDQLNKYIAQNAREPEGYNLRGLCHEKREEYQSAVLDFRRAMKLAPNDQEIRKNHSRVISIWHEKLYEKIEGHKREIAIDPNNPYNYLEIGKSYRYLEEWKLAEEWYDKYLARDDDASPDEIIRYSVILAKTGSIRKGEKILEEYVERYPDDWRLWNRYGYFTMWLGNYKNAQDAFEKALSFKPFFKYAQEGLEIAKRKGYLIKTAPQDYERAPREFPIDRYYRILEDEPNNDQVRFRLVEELIEYDRYQEALEQLEILSPNHKGEERFENLWSQVQTFREEKYTSEIEEQKEVLEEDSTNAEAIRTIAENYSFMKKYDKAAKLLNNYFEKVERDPETRYLLSQIYFYDNKYDSAYQNINIVLENEPDNIDYNLLAGKLGVWLNADLQKAKERLEYVVNEEPNNLDAIVALGTCNFQMQNYDEAIRLANRGKELDPNDTDLQDLLTMIQSYKVRIRNERLVMQLDSARQAVQDEEYYKAINLYESYLDSVDSAPLDVHSELAYVYVKVEDFQNAINVYNDMLSREYDPEVDKRRAKVLYWSGDSLQAHQEFQRLAEENPEDMEVQLYLADTYAQLEEYNKARNIYRDLKQDAPESYMIEQRLDWLPPEYTGPTVWSTIATFDDYLFSYLVMRPEAYYFTDNLDLQYYYGGISFETSVFSFLSVGAFYSRGRMDNQYGGFRYSSFMGNVFIHPAEYWTIRFGYGKAYSIVIDDHPIYQASILYDDKEKLKLKAEYNYNDGAFIFYSPALVGIRTTGQTLNFSGSYNFESGLKISSYYKLLWSERAVDRFANPNIAYPENIGNIFQARAGREFYEDLTIGYEFYFSDYKYDFNLYWTPQVYSSHSLWADWNAYKDDRWDLLLSGKIGYVPQSDYILREFSAKAKYNLYENFAVSANLFLGSSIREEVGYSSGSFFISASWSVY
jgi:tetratricopeptide (TPR) repeat protein